MEAVRNRFEGNRPLQLAYICHDCNRDQKEYSDAHSHEKAMALEKRTILDRLLVSIHLRGSIPLK